MRSYSAFGLGIQSEIPLPELFEDDVADDIQICLGPVERPADRDANGDDYYLLADDTVAFQTPQGGFRIESARLLTVDPSPDTSPAAIRLVILGRAIGAMLQWRGHFVLHASAVARNGRAIAFAGESGAGKSTAAAAFLENGYQLVADDLVAIDMSSSELRVMPGFAQLKLWPDSAHALDIDHGELDRVHERHEKRIVPLDRGQFIGEPLSLDHIFILSQGPKVQRSKGPMVKGSRGLASGSPPGALAASASATSSRIVPLDAQESLVSLLRHAYAPRIMRVFGRQGEHMAQCARIATALSVESLDIDRNSRKLSEVFDVVAARLARV